MLYGIGCDLCEVARMEKSLSGPMGPAFVRRVFGPAEQAALGLGAEAEPWPAGRASAHKAASAAADFAAKEAFLKAAGTGLPRRSPCVRSKPSACLPGPRTIVSPAKRRSGWRRAA